MFVFGSLVQYKGVVQSQNENTHHGFVLFVCFISLLWKKMIEDSLKKS